MLCVLFSFTPSKKAMTIKKVKKAMTIKKYYISSVVFNSTYISAYIRHITYHQRLRYEQHSSGFYCWKNQSRVRDSLVCLNECCSYFLFFSFRKIIFPTLASDNLTTSRVSVYLIFQQRYWKICLNCSFYHHVVFSNGICDIKCYIRQHLQYKMMAQLDFYFPATVLYEM